MSWWGGLAPVGLTNAPPSYVFPSTLLASRPSAVPLFSNPYFFSFLLLRYVSYIIVDVLVVTDIGFVMNPLSHFYAPALHRLGNGHCHSSRTLVWYHNVTPHKYLSIYIVGWFFVVLVESASDWFGGGEMAVVSRCQGIAWCQSQHCPGFWIDAFIHMVTKRGNQTAIFWFARHPVHGKGKVEGCRRDISWCQSLFDIDRR